MSHDCEGCDECQQKEAREAAIAAVAADLRKDWWDYHHADYEVCAGWVVDEIEKAGLVILTREHSVRLAAARVEQLARLSYSVTPLNAEVIANCQRIMDAHPASARTPPPAPPPQFGPTLQQTVMATMMAVVCILTVMFVAWEILEIWSRGS